MNSSHITTDGVATAAWTGVDGNAGEWIQAGVNYVTTGGLQRYVEWNTGGGTPADEHLIPVGAATLGVNYSVVIEHVSSGIWEGEVGGSSWVVSGTLPGTMTETQTSTESQDKKPLADCNALDAVFTSMNPGRSAMSIGVTPPDFVENVGSATFEGVQGQQGS